MDFITPIGRLVQGDAFVGSDTDQQGKPLVIKTGPNAGKPTKKFYQAIAFKKDDQAFLALFGQIVDVAKQGYPQHFNAQGQCTHPRMTYKVVDGDGVDQNGQPNNAKEGFAGHWILKCSSTYAPKCFEAGKYDPSQQLTDPTRIKRGYYVRVAGTMAANIGSDVPGVYINANMIELAGYGPEISSGPQASAVFGAVPLGALPAGASATPVGPQPGMLPGNAQQSYVAQPTGALPGQPAVMQANLAALPGAYNPAAAAPQPQHVTPNPGFVAGALGQLPGAVPGQPPQRQRVMTQAAQGFPYEAFIQQGHTDDSLVQQGLMVWQ